MTLQKIKSLDGRDEYVLLPIGIYRALREEIEDELATHDTDDPYVPFVLEDYVDNPVALARIKAGVSQEQLANRMQVSQAYISKIEAQDKVTAKVLKKINAALEAQLRDKRAKK